MSTKVNLSITTKPSRSRVSAALKAAPVQQIRRKGDHAVMTYELSHGEARRIFRIIKIARVLIQFGFEPSMAFEFAVRGEKKESSMLNATMQAIVL